jgi:hypothetical protein
MSAHPFTLSRTTGAVLILTGLIAISGCSSGGATKTVAQASTTTGLSTATTTAAPTITADTATVTASGNSATQLDAYVAQQAAADQAAATAAGQTWNGSLHSSPIADQGSLVALAAFSYDPRGTPTEVLRYTNGQWHQEAALPKPEDAAPTGGWLGVYPGSTISAFDVTGDGRPDFLIPQLGADNTPGSVVSQDGATGSPPWRYIPFTGPYPTSEIVGRDPVFRNNTLVTTYNNCDPDCAGGSVYPVTWTYERKSGVFWAPNPPGWVAPAGATNHTG